ncbi:photosystem reaction center subunit H [Halobacteriales archaeon QS_8_69_26]|nr:MAG: photosystem reaction center subunit H [Halobacteriales archaeon QS_8_69_26]
MTEMLARNLSNKAVMGSDGTEVGTLHNVTTDLKTGHLRDLVIDPETGAEDANFAFDRDEDGRYRVPANRIEAVKDYIVIRR